MNKAQEVRESVSRAYAKAVQSTAPRQSCCGGDVATKGVAAELAGYTQDELRSLPEAAAVNAFGCGNPVAFSEVREGDVVLDLGSGAGIDLLLAAKKVGPKGTVIGIDMTDEMIAKARQNIRAAGLSNVEVRKGIIEELPVKDATVDWVISNCVINLSPEKPRVFAEIARVLKPGGRMLVSDIVAENLPAWVRESPELHSSCIAGAISEGDYLEGLRKAGLGDTEVRSRLVYDSSQLCAFADSETSSGETSSCCGSKVDDETARRFSREAQGKIWSATIFARKPAS